MLFIDEIEMRVPSRLRKGSTIMQRVMSEFPGEVDGLGTTSDDHVLRLIVATDEFDMIDLTMMRFGRFEANVSADHPDDGARDRGVRCCLAGWPIAGSLSRPELIRATGGRTGAELHAIISHAADRAFLESTAKDAISVFIEMSSVDCKSRIATVIEGASTTSDCYHSFHSIAVASAPASCQEPA